MSAKLDIPALATAQTYFESACRASRAHTAIAAAALKIYGDHGPIISGCVRTHFPEPLKDALRFFAGEVTRNSDLAYAAKPPRVRHATLVRLSREVATRDGSGFYGPQPFRA